MSLGLLRNGLEVTRRVTPLPAPGQSRFEIGDIGVLPNAHPHVRSVSVGEAAERAGIRVGDVVLAVDGRPITFGGQLKEAIAKHPGQPIALSILRGNDTQTIQATPAKRGDQGLLGILIGDETVSIKPGPFEAIGMSVHQNVEAAGLIGQTLWGLVTRETSPKPTDGADRHRAALRRIGGAPGGCVVQPDGVDQPQPRSVEPPADSNPRWRGIFSSWRSKVSRAAISASRSKEKMLVTGFVLILMLMVTVIYNDLTRISWIERLMPWR